MNKKEYKFDHFKNIDEVMYYLNYWYKEEDVYSIYRYLSLKDFNYISNKYQELQQENQKYKKVFDKVKKIIMQPNIEIREYHSCDMDYVYVNEQLLDILKEVE